MAEAENPRANLTVKQAAQLEQFKRAVADLVKPKYQDDDFYMLRWLRARGWDVGKAENMIRKSMSWRKKWDADRLGSDWEGPEVMKTYYPGGVCGYDKEGFPIFVMPTGQLDMKGLSMSCKKTDILKYNIQIIERLYQDFERQSEKLNKRIDKVVVIDDLEHFGMKQMLQPGMDLILKVFAFGEANYPETLKVAYVINAPRVFPLIWKIVKPFLSEDTQKKVVILGRDYKEKLREVIDEDQLPEFWGGSAKDPDGNVYCASKINLGGKVPQEMYLKGSNLVDEEKTTKATVYRGSNIDLYFEVKEPKQILKWIFWTDEYDIKFGISVTGEDGEKKTVVNSNRINCHQVPEDGFINCEQLGTYHIRFDNSYSWINNKTVYYCIEVMSEQEIENVVDRIESEPSSETSSAAGV